MIRASDKRAVIVWAALLAAAMWVSGCSGNAIRAGDSKPEGLVRFEQAVSAEIWPELDELDYEQMQQRVNTLAEEMLVGRRAELHAYALRVLAELPVFDGRLDEYEHVLDAQGQKGLADFGRSFKAELPGDYAATLLASGFWNPVRAAAGWQQMMLARTVGSERIGRRAAAARFVQQRVELVDGDGEEPSLAVRLGPELFVVGLKYDRDSGVYMPGECRWLIHKVNVRR
ncbi:MAG: hypothetical protein JSU94_17260 [Phycisphaerales bacterium]|nr:MAG: hypothetical protein JSU94_17260 [Phycisphaerales bacterium]